MASAKRAPRPAKTTPAVAFSARAHHGRASARPTFARICRSAGGFEPDVRHRANDLRVLLERVAADRAAAVVPALGRPERDPRVAVRRIAAGPFTRAIFVAVRASDRRRPSTATVAAAIAAGPRRAALA